MGERGALVFVKEICSKDNGSGLKEVDLSACRIGFRGCYAIEEALKDNRNAIAKRDDKDKHNIGEGMMVIDLEGNMIFQEVRVLILFCVFLSSYCFLFWAFMILRVLYYNLNKIILNTFAISFLR